MASRLGTAPLAPRIPYAAPRWPKGDALLFAAAGFVAASAAPLSVAVLHTQDQFVFRYLEPGQVLFPALACGLFLAWKTLNAGTAAGAVGWALIGGPVAGAITATLTAVYLKVFGSQGVIFADSALLGIPFGTAFGAMLAWLAGTAAIIRAQRAHDSFDRLLVAIGSWLIAIYGATFVALEGQLLEVVARIGLGFGAASLGAGIARRLARIAWLKRVRAGGEHGWTVREWDVIHGIDQLAPLFGAKPLSCDAVLVHVGDTPGLPYRGARGEIAVALAPGVKVPERVR